MSLSRDSGAKRESVSQLPFTPFGVLPYTKPKVAKKTYEELHEELIQNLIREREYYEPTLSYLAKLTSVRLPIVCEKCRESKKCDEQNDEEAKDYLKSESELKFESNSTASKFFSTSSLSLFSPWEKDDCDKRLCIFYKKQKVEKSSNDLNVDLQRLSIKSAPQKSFQREKSLFESSSLSNLNANTRKSKVAFDLPKSAQPRTSVSSAKLQKKTAINNKLNKNGESKMTEGEIRYTYTSNGLEIKRLISKNWLTVDVLKSDVCKDQNERQQMDWLKKQREEEEERMRQKFPSTIYEQKLKEIMKNLKKGRLPYEVWARQNYEIKLLEEQIRTAKRREAKLKQNKLKRLMEQDKINLSQLKKLKS